MSKLKVSKTFKYRMILNSTQEKKFQFWANSCRFLYNLGLEQRIWYWKNRKASINYFGQNKELTLLKKQETWLKDCPSQILQESLRDLEKSFKNFFKSSFGFPKFKKKSKNASFRFPQPGQKDVSNSGKNGIIKIPKIGNVKFICSRNIAYQGRLRNFTIRKDGLHWFLSLNCEVEIEVKKNEKIGIGIDRGIKKSFQCSNGEVFQLPEKIAFFEKRKKLIQRRLSKKTKFSSNWIKQKNRLSHIHKKIRNIREDFLHKTSTKITKNHGMIFIENLKIKNMSKSASGTIEEPGKNVKAKSGLNRSILNQGWYRFESMLAYKVIWNGGELVKVDAKYTSQICSKFGKKDKDNRRSQEKFKCIDCDFEENADLNAAVNIYTLGLRGSAFGENALASR